MKGESYIFVGMQRPTTMFGLPPMMLGLCFASLFVTFGAIVASGYITFAFPAAVIVLTGLWVTLFRCQRRNHHFANEAMATPGFWRKGQSGERSIIAGLPPTSNRKGP